MIDLSKKITEQNVTNYWKINMFITDLSINHPERQWFADNIKRNRVRLPWAIVKKDIKFTWLALFRQNKTYSVGQADNSTSNIAMIGI